MAVFGVFGEATAVFADGVDGGGEDFAIFGEGDVETGAPFGETEPHLVIFAQAGGERIEAVGVGFGGMIEWDEALVDFDAGDDTVANEVVGVSLAGGSVVAGGFVEEDDAADVVVEVVEGEENVAVIVAMFEIVGDTEAVKLLFDGATGFVGGEDAFAF